MSNVKIIADKQDFISVADLLRSKTNSSKALTFPEGFKEAIRNINVVSGGGGSSETPPSNPSNPSSKEFLTPIKLNKASYQTFSLSLIEAGVNVNSYQNLSLSLIETDINVNNDVEETIAE